MGKFRWSVWLLFNLVWTTALIMPFSDELGASVDKFTWGRRALLGKSLHVAAYALFAILSGWVRVPMQRRSLLIFFIMAHATATELIQKYFTNRTGQLEDVGLDTLGVLIGFGLSWKWWMKD